MMQLELFPNELLLELFEFLNGVHLFRAFYSLNSRFNKLLLVHYQNFRFNFEHVPKEDFDIICQKHLPSIIDRVISIRISDDLETPKLPELFLYYGFTLNRFMHLKSLSLCSMMSMSILMETTFQCQYFPNLTHLNMVNCTAALDTYSSDGVILCNNIWRLPKLTHCDFGNVPEMENYMFQISEVSSSIKNLSIEDCNLTSLFHLLEYTPNLRRLHIKYLWDRLYSQQKTNITSSLTSLSISFAGHETVLIHIFQSLPKLRYLTLEISSIIWNGYKWEEILDTFLPQLQVFRFKTEYYPLKQEEDVDKLLDSFRTPFWLEKHQWSVGCQRNLSIFIQSVRLSTLPYAFDDVFYESGWGFKSTCPNEEKYYLCDRVQNFTYSFGRSLPDAFPFRYPNICHLHVDFLHDPVSFSWFSSLKYLRSLHISIKEKDHYRHLQNILNHIPRLYSLHLKIACDSHRKLFQLTSSSIRRLELLPVRYSFRFTNKDCINLISSPLGRQCEVLSVYVDNRNSVLNLIQNMSNLRSLYFECTEDKSYHRESNDDFLLWLQNHLPPICSFNEYRWNIRSIEVWINRQKKTTPAPTVQNKVFSLFTSFKRLFENLRRKIKQFINIIKKNKDNK